MPISIPTTWVVTTGSGIGEEDPDIIVALSHRRRPPAHTAEPTGTHLNGKTGKYRTSENSCRIGSPPGACQGLQQAPLSLAVLMDGEPSIHGGRCPFPNAPHVTTEALRRVRKPHYYDSLPSELNLSLSRHPAQAHHEQHGSFF